MRATARNASMVLDRAQGELVESALSALRKGSKRVSQRASRLGVMEFFVEDVVESSLTDTCPPPCSTRLVRGVCPECGRVISFRLGRARETSAKLAPLPPSGELPIGFGFDRPARLKGFPEF